jgi:hypothetical protein
VEQDANLRELIRFMVSVNSYEAELGGRLNELKSMLNLVNMLRVLFEFLEWKFGGLLRLMEKI